MASKCQGRICHRFHNELTSRIQIRNSGLEIRGSESERNIYGDTTLIARKIHMQTF
jgi:hypothetical protein